MPAAEEIQHYLTGAWRMMTGRPEGLRMLDVSADGFWNSFFAIVVACPALVVGWVTLTNDLGMGGGIGDRLFTVVRLAIVDIGSWVLPLVILALVARPIGIADRFAHYVVASNWASALLVWIMLPPALIRMFWPAGEDVATLVSLGLFLVTLVLLWRLTNVAIGKGAAMATAVFCGMFAASLAVLVALQLATGLGAR